MQSEHLTNLHPGWVVGGWLISAATTGMIYVVGVGAGLTMAGPGEVVWVVVSMFGGFFVGGLFVGMRWLDAPMLHGAAITGFSVMIWFFASLIGGFKTIGDGTQTTLGLVLIQLLGAVGGAVMGRRTASPSAGPAET